jgi:hypothetical protein
LADGAALVEGLLRDFPEMRFGYRTDESPDVALRHLVRHMAYVTNELAAKEPENAGIAKAFEWAERLSGEGETASLAVLFEAHLSPMAREVASRR